MKVLATDLLDSRLELAAQLGATRTLRVKSENRMHKTETRFARSRSKNEIKRDVVEGVRTRSGAGSLSELALGLTHSRGLDAAIIAVPSDDVAREAQRLVRGGGKVLLFSHTRRGVQTAFDLATVCVDEKDLIGSYSADFLLQKEVARLVFSRKLDVRRLITHQFPLEQTLDAIALAAEPSADSLKVLVTQS